MNRLLVNPGTPQAWEIALKPGANRIGRSEDNDFTIPHSSVSSSHCEVVVTDDGVFFRDLGSTNGSFVNRARVNESPHSLQNGQHIQLGSVDLIFEAGPKPLAAAAPASAAPPPVRVRISTPVAAMPPVAVMPDGDVPLPPPPTAGLHIAHSQDGGMASPPVARAAHAHSTVPGEPPMLDVRDAFCKSHPKSPARFFCAKCSHYFCDLCVATRNTAGMPAHFCRHCGNVCAPVRVRITPSKESKLGFFGRMPGAFSYPFHGSGVFMLIGGSVLYVLLHFCPLMLVIGNLWMKAWGLMGGMVIGGYLAAFFQSIIHTTATGDKEMPSMPSVTNLWEDVLIPMFQFSGVLFACFGPALTLVIMSAVSESSMAAYAYIPFLLLGCVYFPMGYLAVVLLDSIKALNPLIVFQSIRRVPLEYLATLGLLAVVAVLATLGDGMMLYVIGQGLSTSSIKKFFLMIGLFVALVVFGFYLITVSVRVLGLLFVTKRDKLGWYEH